MYLPFWFDATEGPQRHLQNRGFGSCFGFMCSSTFLCPVSLFNTRTFNSGELLTLSWPFMSVLECLCPMPYGLHLTMTPMGLSFTTERHPFPKYCTLTPWGPRDGWGDGLCWISIFL